MYGGEPDAPEGLLFFAYKSFATRCNTPGAYRRCGRGDALFRVEVAYLQLERGRRAAEYLRLREY